MSCVRRVRCGSVWPSPKGQTSDLTSPENNHETDQMQVKLYVQNRTVDLY